jgi:hypothetical protein
LATAKSISGNTMQDPYQNFGVHQTLEHSPKEV